MNNYNVVFKTIKKHCQSARFLDRGCYERVLAEIESRRTLNSPYQYLDILRDMGLIKYCPQNRIIGLTEKGKNTTELFGE